MEPQDPPERCKRCSHVIRWSGLASTRYDCLRGVLMHPNCAWHGPRSELIAPPQSPTTMEA